MDISYHTTVQNLDLATGYGQAGFKVVTSLQALGHRVPFDDKKCPVQLAFSSPKSYKFHPGQYKIGYTPWESTALPPGWLEGFNSCDEVWATNDYCADIYRNCGVKPPVYVYEHGIDDIWQPVDRTPSSKVRFLHFGAPAHRKHGQLTLDAFRDAFGDREDVHMTFKTYDNHGLRAWSHEGVTTPNRAFENVSVVNRFMEIEELVDFHNYFDVLVYPSAGEGFGLIPLQALATGMPVICTEVWASYKRFLGPLGLQGEYQHSPWIVHPGKVYQPDYDQLVDMFIYAYDNIDTLRKQFVTQAPDVIKEYDWLDKTEKAFQHIVERFTTN
jgi:glycosyltransferase involved in cell wall biosynthesis